MNKKAWLAAALLAATATTAAAQARPEGYSCCNFHYDKDWISDANWRNLPMIPLGAEIKVLDYGWNRANVEINGKPMRIGHDYGRSQESLENFIAKLVVKSDPQVKVKRYGDKVRAAIKEGRVLEGMARDQVLLSVGYPPTHRTPSLDATVWNYWASRAGRYEVHWNSKGTVEKIGGGQ